MARPKGTKAKRPITKELYYKLIHFVNECKDIKPVSKEKLKIAYTLLYTTGCRISEIKDFTNKDLDFIIEHKNYSTDNNTKTSKARFIKFSDMHIELIKKHYPKKEGYLFNKNKDTKPMSITGLTNLCNQYIHEALGELYSSHGFRRNMVTSILKSTGRLSVAQAHIGHKNPITTARYDIATEEDIEDALNRTEW